MSKDQRVATARAACIAKGATPLASTGLTDEEYAADVAVRLNLTCQRCHELASAHCPECGACPEQEYPFWPDRFAGALYLKAGAR